ncbi:pyridoxal-phosphate dependent enzyme [Nocardia terpenica]|nr:pyridoxal-phosphate dependent enzyme [Nocardia terpenica]
MGRVAREFGVGAVPGRWARSAVSLLRGTRAEEAATPLRRFPLPGDSSVELFVKDESVHPTGSLKHRFARSLLVDALERGRIDEGTPLFEATSGNLAVAEAYFATMLGLPYTAVIPERTAAAKAARIEEQGGRCHRVDPPLAVYEHAARLARESGGYHLDHLHTLAGAVDREGESDLAAEILRQCEQIDRPVPTWIVAGVGTGATSRSIGRHLRAHHTDTRLAVVDPEHSAYFAGWATDTPDYATGMPSRIDGIGRPRVEPPFDPDVVDLVIPVLDATTVAAMRHLHDITGWLAGPSSGATLFGALQLVARMREHGESGTVIALQADSGTPYADTFYNDTWVASRGWDLSHPTALLRYHADTGIWTLPQHS